jgi:hypothetical protein
VLHDRYLDTPDGQLAARHVALRLREIGQTRLLALKSGDEETDGVSSRFELEAPWSGGALAAVLERLRWQGVDLPGAAAEDSASIDASGDPVAVCNAIGLHVVQDRHTRRQPRDVLPPLASSPEDRIAELAVDAVRYHLDDSRVRIFEVEVEAKGGGDAIGVARVLLALDQRFPGRLRAWPHSKLATGFALRDLLARGELTSHLGPDGVLGDTGVDVVDAILSGGPAPA